MRNVVLDTNVFVAAGFNKRSSSSQIFQLIDDGEVGMVWDKDTKRETKLIVSKIPPLSWKKFEGYFGSDTEYRGQTKPEEYAMVEDFDDRKFAALAAATGAALISNDDHLLSVRDNLEINIVTPSEFMQKLT